MRAVLFLVALLVLTACTVPGTPTPAPHPLVQPAPDRDPRAVLSAVRKLDFCKLVAPGKGTRPIPAPHGCLIFGAGEDRFTVFVTARGYATAEARGAALDIGGARVYLVRDSANTYCNADIPVSYKLAITVLAAPGAPGRDVCATVQQLVANAVRGLADPGRFAVPDDPYLLWTPCELLGQVGAVKQSGQRLQSVAGALGDCTAGGEMKLSMEVNNPPEGSPYAVIDGVRVVRIDAANCNLAWAKGTTVVHVDGQECTETEQTAREVLALLRTPPPTVPPQRPLTYPPDDSDVPAVGACVDYDGPSCQPYQPVAVPQGAQPVTDAMAHDPFVLCAVAVDGVRQAFPRLRAVVDTSGPACHFVSPTHDVDLEFLLDPAGDASLGHKVKAVDVGGHAAYTWDDGTSYYACLLTELTSGAQWCVQARFRPARDQPVDAEADTSGVAKLPVVLTAAARYL